MPIVVKAKRKTTLRDLLEAMPGDVWDFWSTKHQETRKAFKAVCTHGESKVRFLTVMGWCVKTIEVEPRNFYGEEVVTRRSMEKACK